MQRIVIRLGKTLAAVAVMAIAFVAGLLAAPHIAASDRPWVIPLVPPTSRAEEDLYAFWEAWRAIDRHYYGKPVSKTSLMSGAIHGLIAALDDPHSVYLAAEDMTGHRQELDGTASSVGMAVERRNGRLLVVAPLAGSPAQQAGIRAGDQILAIDGHDASFLSLSQALRLLRGPIGAGVTLLVLREGGEPFSTIVQRGNLSVPLLTVRTLPNAILYVNISYCDKTVTRDLGAALAAVPDGGVRGIVLDLRNNPGGYLDVAIELAGVFIPEGVIVSQQGRAGTSTWAYRDRGRVLVIDGPEGRRSFPSRQPIAPTAPVVVLVNRGTASAAEVLAAALQDHGRAVLVGETTFGKSVITGAYPLRDGSVIHLTSAVWLSPKGRRSDSGLAPDFSATDTGGAADAALDWAVRYLMSR